MRDLSLRRGEKDLGGNRQTQAQRKKCGRQTKIRTKEKRQREKEKTSEGDAVKNEENEGATTATGV